MGDSIELECHMTGSAPIKVTWSKDHKDIRTGGNYKIGCVENTPHLTILKADKADTGKYFCHASNDMGKDSCSSDITVKGISTWATHTSPRALKLALRLFLCVKKKQTSSAHITVFSCFQSVKTLQCSPKSPQSTLRTWRVNW